MYTVEHTHMHKKDEIKMKETVFNNIYFILFINSTEILSPQWVVLNSPWVACTLLSTL